MRFLAIAVLAMAIGCGSVTADPPADGGTGGAAGKVGVETGTGGAVGAGGGGQAGAGGIGGLAMGTGGAGAFATGGQGGFIQDPRCVGANIQYCPGVACTDLTMDTANCGSCGNACAGGQICWHGYCACLASASDPLQAPDCSACAAHGFGHTCNGSYCLASLADPGCQ